MKTIYEIKTTSMKMTPKIEIISKLKTTRNKDLELKNEDNPNIETN